MDGWIKLHRKSLESSVWTNHNVWRVWCWCLLKANHEKHKFPFNQTDIEVKPGQFITGREKACQELGLTSQKFRKSILHLQNTQRITSKTTNKFTLISVINWHKYQIDNQQKNQQRTNKEPTKNQQRTTYKNDKNDKNDKNYINIIDFKKNFYKKIKSLEGQSTNRILSKANNWGR